MVDEVALSPISLTPIFSNNGELIRTAKLYFYRPDTLDPITVYKDQTLSVPHPQPITVGGSGRIPPIYVGPDDYRVRIFDDYGQLVEDIPFLPAATAAGGGGGGGGDDTAIEVGDVIWRFSNGGVRAGWVRLNGNTIGSASSGATERANDDTHNLFVWLWGQDSGSLNLTITPSRGASAEGDWLSNKQLALPDGRNAFLGGISAMGAASNLRLLGATFDKGDGTEPGAAGGRATHSLTTPQLASHTHGITDPGHVHTATQAAHNHTATQPAHSHVDNGHSHNIYDPTHNHILFDGSHAHTVWQLQADAGGGSAASGSGRQQNAVASSYATSNISIAGAATGISIYSGQANIALTQPTITVQNAQPAITVANGTTGISTVAAGTGAAHPTAPPFVLGTWYMRL